MGRNVLSTRAHSQAFILFPVARHTSRTFCCLDNMLSLRRMILTLTRVSLPLHKAHVLIVPVRKRGERLGCLLGNNSLCPSYLDLRMASSSVSRSTTSIDLVRSSMCGCKSAQDLNTPHDPCFERPSTARVASCLLVATIRDPFSCARESISSSKLCQSSAREALRRLSHHSRTWMCCLVAVTQDLRCFAAVSFVLASKSPAPVSRSSLSTCEPPAVLRL